MGHFFELPKGLHPCFQDSRRKPLCGIKLDAQSRLTDGLEALFISDGRQLINLLDQTNNLDPTTTDTSDVSSSYISNVGEGTKLAPGTGDNDGLASNFKISSTSEYTVGYYGRLDTRDSTRRRFMAGQTQVGTGTGYDMGGPYVNTDGTVVFYAKNGSGVGSTGTINNGDVFTWSGRYKSGETNGHRQHLNGELDGTATNTGAAGTTYTYQVGRRWGGFEAANATTVLIPIWGRALSDDEIVAWHREPFLSLLAPDIPLVLFVPSSSGLNGTLNKTLDALTLTASADVIVDGTLNQTLGSLTLTSAAELPIDAALSATLGALTLTSAADILIDSTLASTLGALTLTSNVTIGSSDLTGTLDITLGSLSLASSADVLIDSTLAATLGSLTLTSSAEVLLDGILNSSLAALTLTSAATITDAMSVTLNITFEALSVSGQTSSQLNRMSMYSIPIGGTGDDMGFWDVGGDDSGNDTGFWN